jgi:hypothetical protein
MGIVPNALHRGYSDMNALNIKLHRGPSSSVGCEMAAAFVGAQSLRILLGHGNIRCAPHCLEMDIYTGKVRTGRGNKKSLLRKL